MRETQSLLVLRGMVWLTPRYRLRSPAATRVNLFTVVFECWFLNGYNPRNQQTCLSPLAQLIQNVLSLTND